MNNAYDNAPSEYWSHPKLETIGLTWQWADISSPSKTLGEALTHDEKFMDEYIYKEADYLAKNAKTEPHILEMWTLHCSHAMNRADYRSEQEWKLAYEEYANILATEDEIYNWAFNKISSDVSDYWYLIIDMCRDGGNPYLRKEHPITGCYDSNRNEVIPLSDILGWCRSCGYIITMGDLTHGRDIGGSGRDVIVYHCTDCGNVDEVVDNQDIRPFHLPIAPRELGLNEENN